MKTLAWYDWLVLVAFLTWVVVDGVRRSRGTRTLEGYFAGGRTIPWWAAGLSVMATQASAITVIGTTGQGHDGGLEFVQFYFGLAFAMVVLSAVLVPNYRAHPILSAYELLELRLGPATRTLASGVFLVSRCLAFGAVLYAPAVVLSAMTGLDLTAMVLVMGVLTTLYTTLGGVNAVIWTDVKQMTVILGGLLVCLGVLLYEALSRVGPVQALDLLGAAGKLNAFELEPASTGLLPRVRGAAGPPSFWEDRYNFWSGLLGGLFLHLAYFGCDQSQVQRILTNPSARESRMALLVSAFAKVPMQLVVLFVGVLIWLFAVLEPGPMLFKPEHVGAAAGSPEVRRIEAEWIRVVAERRETALRLAALEDGVRSDPALLERYRERVARAEELRRRARTVLGGGVDERDTNYVFPWFILGHLPPILLGLVVASIFAAAMSSADSALNSLTAASVVDFYKRWIRPDAEDEKALRISRALTVLWGAGATGAALLFEGRGAIIETINKVGSYFYGTLLGVFLLALGWRRAGPRAGVVGLVGGMASVLLVHFNLEVEYLWYNVVGAAGVLAAGVAASFFERRGRR